ncbi:9310_t:CDS:2, partial [Funneliformis geosporum]
QSLLVSILAEVVRARKAVSQLAFAKIVFLSCPLMVWSGCCKAIQRALTATTAVSLVALSIDTSNNSIYVAIEDLFDLDQVLLYPGNNNEFENEDELSEINESNENNSDLNKSQEEKDDNSSNYNYNIKELTTEMM